MVLRIQTQTLLGTQLQSQVVLFSKGASKDILSSSHMHGSTASFHFDAVDALALRTSMTIGFRVYINGVLCTCVIFLLAPFSPYHLSDRICDHKAELTNLLHQGQVVPRTMQADMHCSFPKTQSSVAVR